MTLVLTSACAASVRTACCTASRASSVLGRNSLLSRPANSSASSACVACAFSVWGFAMSISSKWCGLLRRVRGSAFGGLGGSGQRLHQRGILQHLGDQLFGAGLAVHVRQEVV